MYETIRTRKHFLVGVQYAPPYLTRLQSLESVGFQSGAHWRECSSVSLLNVATWMGLQSEHIRRVSHDDAKRDRYNNRPDPKSMDNIRIPQSCETCAFQGAGQWPPTKISGLLDATCCKETAWSKSQTPDIPNNTHSEQDPGKMAFLLSDPDCKRAALCNMQFVKSPCRWSRETWHVPDVSWSGRLRPGARTTAHC